MATAVHHGETEQQASWLWDYASMRAPDRNELYYFKFTCLSIAFYMAVHLAVHLIALRKSHVYQEMSYVKRTEYRTYIVSPIHALFAVSLSTMAMFFICGDGKTVFNNDACFSTVRYIHIWALLNTCGYFFTDFFFLFFIIQGRTTLDYQTYAHHLVACATYYQTLYWMDFMCVFGCMLLFIEISSPFVCMRWLLFTHGLVESKWYAINAVAMFVVFFLSRIVYQFYVCFWFGSDWMVREYERDGLTWVKGIVFTELIIMVLLSIALNVYWMLLMCRMILRVINRASKPKGSKEEKIELVNADSLAIGNEAECGSST